jgi:type IV pilus assembly protein PilA
MSDWRAGRSLFAPKGNMLKTIKHYLGRDEEQGFTLIELMVVVLIIAILLAIAIPTFLGARNTANARSTQSDLRNALTAEQTNWTNTQAFDATTTDMQGIEPSIGWSNTTPITTPGGNTVLVTSPDANHVVLVGLAKDGSCYAIEQSNDPAGSYTGYAAWAKPSAGCATEAPAALTSGASPGVQGTFAHWYSTF